MNHDIVIFADLINKQIIPKKGIFIITDNMKHEYVKTYASIKGQGNFGKNSNEKYALKLAGLSLLKLNEKRRLEFPYVTKETKVFSKKTISGIIYLISNPAFEGYIKVGITKDLNKRLATYQTYDPLRRYKVEHYKVVANAKETEKFILKHHSIDLAKGEWVKDINIKTLFLNNLE